jgi:hypothetical protein
MTYSPTASSTSSSPSAGGVYSGEYIAFRLPGGATRTRARDGNRASSKEHELKPKRLEETVRVLSAVLVLRSSDFDSETSTLCSCAASAPPSHSSAHVGYPRLQSR